LVLREKRNIYESDFFLIGFERGETCIYLKVPNAEQAIAIDSIASLNIDDSMLYHEICEFDHFFLLDSESDNDM
jgi:hypothetical protein